jgi:hypothetical protein
MNYDIVYKHGIKSRREKILDDQMKDVKEWRDFLMMERMRERERETIRENTDTDEYKRTGKQLLSKTTKLWKV